MADKFEVQLRECLLTWNNMLIKYWCSWKFWGKNIHFGKESNIEILKSN